MARNPTPRLDLTRQGSQSYAPRDVDTVERLIRTGTRRNPVSVATIADATHIDGRAVRQINSDHGGVRWVVAECPDGWFVPEAFEDVEPKFRAWRQHIRAMQTRLDREFAWAEAHLPHRQTGLFDVPEPEEPDDDD
jgi:hypothetical protein